MIISIHVSMSPVSARVLFVASFNRFCQVVALTTHWLETALWRFGGGVSLSLFCLGQGIFPLMVLFQSKGCDEDLSFPAGSHFRITNVHLKYVSAVAPGITHTTTNYWLL